MTFSGRLMPYGLCVGTTGHRLSFSQLVARGEATPLRGLRGVRNADDWPVGAQIGHSAVKRPDDVIQTEFNELTEQWPRGLFNVKHLRTLGLLAYTVGS